MPSQLLNNFEIHKYYQNEPKFDGAYSKKCFPNSNFSTTNAAEEKTFVIILVGCKSVRSHRIVLYVSGNNVTYFDSFGVEHSVSQW